MFNIIIGIIIGIFLMIVYNSITRKKEPNYDKIIKKCMEEANADLSKNGKKKHSNSGGKTFEFR